MRNAPPLVQIERQCRVTLVLLPYVAGLPFVDEEVIVSVFGATMAMLNWLPMVPTLPPLEKPPRRARTKEEQRAYWREKQREYRMRDR